MSTVLDAVAVVLLIAGAVFLVISALGLARFPDFWTRAHAVAKAETLGLVLVFIGLIVLNRLGPGSLQLALIAGFSLLLNPTAIHALARSAARRPDILRVVAEGERSPNVSPGEQRAPRRSAQQPSTQQPSTQQPSTQQPSTGDPS